jgi:hypothetical protein
VSNSKGQDVDIIMRNSLASVMPGRFAMVKVQEIEKEANYFFLANDGEENTMVVKEANLSQVRYEEIQKWFKLIRLAVSVPFFSVGFLAKVASAIADRGINILIISTYSNDYLLIRENDVEAAFEALKALGFRTK